jgi:hypothetical protein
MVDGSFHCYNTKEAPVDRCGAAVDDLTEAPDQAASAARSLTNTRDLEDWRDRVVHVSDDLGDEFFSYPFAHVLGKPH